MNFSITFEVFTLLYSTLAGITIAAIYDLFKILRKTTKAGIFFSAITDIVFWILATAIMFFVIFNVNNGKLRWYQFFGAFSGGIIWFLLFSRPFIFLICRFIDIFFKIFEFFLKILLTPLKFMYNIIYVSLSFVFSPVLRLFKRTFRKICYNIGKSVKTLKFAIIKK